MRASFWLPSALLLAASCGKEEPEPLPNPPIIEETGDTAAEDNTFEPVAVGFEFEGVVLSDGTLTGFVVNGQEVPPSVILTFASQDFFSAGDQATQDEESCMAWGTWAPAPRDEPLPVKGGMPLWNSYEGALVLEFHTCADKLGEEWGEDAMRIGEVFSGMRLGIAFGPMTDYLRDAWSEQSLEEYGDYLFAEYIAINNPDGSFVGEDWTSAIVFEWDQNTGELVTDDTGEQLVPIQTSHLPGGAALPQGYVRSFAYWYQDFPLMDFDKLKDNVPD